MVANAGLAILQGRLLDRLGQARVLSAASLVFGCRLALLVWSVEAGWPTARPYVFAAAGRRLRCPQVGSRVRARWSHVLDDSPPSVQTAFALEAVARRGGVHARPDRWSPCWRPPGTRSPGWRSRVAACAGRHARVLRAARRPSRRPHATRAGDRARGRRCPGATWSPLAVVCAALGMLFGAAEVTTVAFADEQGHRAASGVLLAPVGARQPARRAWSPARSPGGAARPCGCAGAAFAMACAMVPAALRRLGAGDGRGAVRRRLRDRADADRHDVADRAASPPAGSPRAWRSCRPGWSPGWRPAPTLAGSWSTRTARPRRTSCRVGAGVLAALRRAGRPRRPSATLARRAVDDARGATGRAWRRRHRRGCVEPADTAAVVAAVRAGPREARSTVKMVGTGHSFTAIAAPEGTHAAPGRAGRDHRGRPGRDDRHRARRHAAEGAQRRARAARAEPAQHGRHRRADAGRRHLDRHPRHRRRRGRRCPPRSRASSWSPAPARCCARPPRRTPTSSRSPGSGSARSAS